MRPRSPLLRAGALVVLVLGGCTLGRGPQHDFVPQGLRVNLRWPASEAFDLFGHPTEIDLFGEVLAMQEDGILFWRDMGNPSLPENLSSPLMLVTFRALEPASIRLSSRSRVSARRGRTLRLDRPEDVAYLANWSRYDGPVGAEVIEALIHSTPATELAVMDVGSGAAEGAGGTPPEWSRDDFLQEARLAASRFSELSAAVANGYRRLGPDFPGMGEHWVHPGRIVQRGIDPAEPPVLTYAEVGGVRVLTGVAYAVPLGPSDRPPPTPFGPGVWHDHTQTLDEEAILLDSPSTHQRGDGAQPRLAMFHVWLWPQNPDGALSQNNWALPFARLGLSVPDTLDQSTARAVSLVGAGRGYYTALVTRAARAEGTDRDVVAAVVEEASARVEALVRGRESVDSAERSELSRIWQELWGELAQGLSPEAWARLEPAARIWTDHPDVHHHDPSGSI